MRFTCASGTSVSYAVRGDGPSVVLLHPVGLDKDFWTDVVDVLSSRFRVIGVDLPGHGDSDAVPSPITLAGMAQPIVELISAIGHSPVAIVGCSLGGMVAQAVVIERPDLVSALVLANTSHTRDEASRRALLKRSETVVRDMAATVTDTIDRWFDENYSSNNVARVDALRARLEAVDPHVHAAMWQAIANLDHRNRLNHIAVPTLVISGSKDQSVPRAASIALAAEIPAAQFVEMQDVGHLAPYERPVEFAHLVEEFLLASAKSNGHKPEEHQ